MNKGFHDIRPPEMTGMDPALVQGLLWAAGAIVLCALIVLAVRNWLKKRKNKGLGDTLALPLLSFYETAVRDLEQCLVNFGTDAKVFYFELGRIVKAYISGTFDINCSEMTSQEMARAVKSLEFIDTGLGTELIRFQETCDPIRYMPLDAVDALDAGRMQQDLAQAGALVARIEQVVADAHIPDQAEDA